MTHFSERLLYESGKIELSIRLFLTPFGLFFLWCAFLVFERKAIIPGIICCIFSFIFLAPWIYQWRMFYDSSRQQLVFRSWGAWRISLSGAEAVYVNERPGGGPFVGAPRVDIGLRYQGGRERWVLGQPTGDPKRLAVIISEATGLPIIRY